MNELCLEHCAIERDCSGFEPKPTDFDRVPRFPNTAGMTKEERFTAVCYYLGKITDYLQGVEDERISRRSRLNDPRSKSLPKNLKVKALLHGIEETNSAHKNRKERQDQTIGPAEVATAAD